MIGSPLDIPWINRCHDGFPLSRTLEGYIAIRRTTHAPLSFRDDLALWLGAMTFGFLEAVMEMKIAESQLLTRDEEGGMVISGERLFLAIVSWIASDDDEDERPREHSLVERHQWACRVTTLLRQTLSTLEEVMVTPHNVLVVRNQCDSRTAVDFACPILVMVFTVFYAFLIHLSLKDYDFSSQPELASLVATYMSSRSNAIHVVGTHAMRRRMLKAGWCPHIISPTLLRTIPLTALSNFIDASPPVRRTIGEHQQCSEESCVFYTISNVEDYKNPHTPLCSDTEQCPHIAPPACDVEKLLEEGKIPVVVYLDQELLVLPAAEVPGYVAISHVWADGLGSTSDKGLPTCQIARISQLARSLMPQSGAFWMDSLCVPSVSKLRKRAIALMAETYKEAEKVVVLDNDIRTQCSLDTNVREENAFRIATSGWVRRVWTLQEGILARELYFELEDGKTFNLSVFDELEPDKPASSGISYSDYLPLIYHRSRMADGHTFELSDISVLLGQRSTTNVDDETLAIAGLLRLDVQKLLDVSGSSRADIAARRMKSLYIQLGEQLPRDIIFGNAPRLQLPNFRWAPSSLAAQVLNSPMAGNIGAATCTEAGIRGYYAVGQLNSAVFAPVPADLASLDNNGFKFAIQASQRDGTGPSMYVARVTAANPAFRAGVTDNPPSFNCLLFLQHTMPSDGALVPCAAVNLRADLNASERSKPLCVDYVASLVVETRYAKELRSIPALKEGCHCSVTMQELYMHDTLIR